MITLNGAPLRQVVGRVAGGRRAQRRGQAAAWNLGPLEVEIMSMLPASGPGVTTRGVAVATGRIPDAGTPKVPHSVFQALRRLEARGLVRSVEGRHPRTMCPQLLWFSRPRGPRP